MFGEKLKNLSIETINPNTNEPYTAPEVAVQTGISVATWYRYLENLTIPSSNKLIKLAELFNTSVDYLLDDSIPLQSSETIPVNQIRLRGEKMNDQQIRMAIQALETILDAGGSSNGRN
ncbi:MAG: helix-turn-helix transcriptional regulator [Chloroflexota bacterium]